MAFARLRMVVVGAAVFIPALGPLGCGLIQGQSGEQVAPPQPHGHVFFRVQAPSSAGAPVAGRLLIFVRQGSGDSEITTSEFSQENTWVAAKEVISAAPGEMLEINADELAFPRPFMQLPPGKYEAQAVLDTDHSYNYKGRGPQDWISPATSLGNWQPGSVSEPLLVLDHHPPGDMKRSAGRLALTAKAKFDGAHEEEFVSPLLSRFWGHEVKIRSWVISPPGYSGQSRETYPTAYWTQGFGAGLDSALLDGLRLYDRMKDGTMPPMFWVMLDESIPQGTHEFADSVNNGPWGAALTTEFIPYLEAKYRMDARPNGRFLNGHSSGGWATLQLQINYPYIFGGTWSTSPDSSDFHDFNGPDLYAAHANLYRKPDGSPWPIIRGEGKVEATFEQLARLENVLGPYGGQLGSFDWVFSPRGPNGAPEPMFDRRSGDVHPQVIAYWRDHYDLAHLIENTWSERGPLLKGRIHVFVGTADTFYLDGPAHRLEAVLDKLGGDPHFSYLPGRTHFNVYLLGDDANGLIDQIATEMYAVARPGVAWKDDLRRN
ncbi:hypothetical protein ACPOL_0042 [Acidisarcina polymorpha]|uniref:Esterase n=1 Tax=Acidisarcina polymorpha TaxID=2211140 RepID=A0A2Z5FRV8_9BACT|nr:alpha/beta hydrolase-fold protein [Acidisarcina polymorpha]AXC09429.1 hypothetical protein ACPOL_0042 [Acidisarcina polymorpha]